MFLGFSFFASIIPMTLYMLILWFMDKYEREPLLFVVVHFLWGAFGAVVLGILGNVFIIKSISFFTCLLISSLPDKLISSLIAAPISEEVSKALFLLFSVNSKKFDNITDGIVYGGAIGLGFGMTENFIYFLTYGTTLDLLVALVILRSLSSAIMHCISTATFGAVLGFTKFFTIIKKIIFMIMAIVISIFIHFIWNLSVSSSETFLYGFIFMTFLIIFFMILFSYSLRKEKVLITNELLEESQLNIIPAEHVKIIASKSRFQNNLINEKIRKKYFKTAVALAFNKMHMKNSKGAKKIYYENEIENKRRLIKELLNNNNSN